MMKSGFWRRAGTAVLVYAVAFVGLVFLQYSSGRGFSWRSGIVSLHGSMASASANASPSFELTLDGLVLRVDAAHPALVVLADGSKKRLDFAGLEGRQSGARATFRGQVYLDLTSRGSGNVGITASGGDTSLRSVELAMRGGLPSSWTRGDRSSLVISQGTSWRISIDSEAFGDAAVDLPIGQTVAIESVSKPDQGKSTYVVKSDAEYRQSILAWLDKAWSGLSDGRFDQGAFKWKQADGSSAFSEPALAAWLAEGFRRGQGEPLIGKARQSRDLFAKALTWLTMPYFGDTMAKMADIEAVDAKTAKTLAQQADAKDPTILETPDLVSRLVDRGPKGLYSSVLAFISTLDPASLSIRQRVGLLSAAATAGNLLRNTADGLPNHVVAESLVLSGMVRADGLWFLKVSEDGKVDVATSLDAGLSLVSLGKIEGKDSLLAAGQALVDGALSLADQQGFLPASLSVADGAIGARSGSLAPETLYAKIADNPWYPHEVSFAKDLEPGVWAWTCAPSLTVEASTGRKVFSASFPVGIAHYMSIYGIPSFANIKLYGIDYSPDSQFESYNVSGYYYRASTEALYLKMRHKTEVEKIELDY